MKLKNTFVATTFVVAIALAIAVPKATADNKAKHDRLDGWVEMIDTGQNKISLRTGNDVPRFVFFDAKTAYTYRNEPASFEQVQVGRRVICVGKLDSKGRTQAERIDVRLKN